ncbi:MAG: tyrosine-type recombinase/integrase [Candidatus Woesearchaeota archaeon]|nr:tyrosine-type recombinase/integrase [Candidatus Woesearchaeota archaeon]
MTTNIVQRIQELLPRVDTRTAILLRTLLETGVKTGELVKLQTADLNETTLIVRGKHTRAVTISQKLAATLSKQQGRFFFPSRNRVHMSEERVRQLLKKHNIKPREIRKEVLQ